MGQDQTVEARLARLQTVADSLLDAEGDLPREMRAAAFAHASAVAGRPVPGAAPLPEPLGGFVAKVTAQAYRIGDADVDALRQAGYSDDAILEAVLSTAVGAGLSRLEIGLNAIAGSR
ncbi:MAG: hypothetical protein M3326_00070 [Actinomycetota bacterium]|nr:hypothetical protein [Actinomycetota bacterium]